MAKLSIDEKYIIEKAKEMISIPSVVGSEREIGEYLYREFKEMGLRTRKIGIADGRSDVIGEVGEGSPVILLNAHIDTVGISKGWEHDPFTPMKRDGRIYGRGAVDDKGPLAGLMGAVKAVIERKGGISGTLILTAVSDEEGEDLGIYYLINEYIGKELREKPSFAVVADSGGREEIILGHKGRYGFEIELFGKTAHASKYPKEGISAIRDASEIILLIEDMPRLEDPELGRGSTVVLHIEGGQRRVLSVPDYCKILVAMHAVPGETIDDLMERLRRVLSESGIKSTFKIRLAERSTPYPEPYKVPENLEIVKVIKRMYRELYNMEIKTGYGLSVCDANYLVNLAKIPTIVIGPKGGNAHRENEYVEIESLLRFSRVLAESLAHFLLKNT